VSGEGKALIEKWVSGAALSDDERRTLPIVKATYMYRAWNKKTGGGPRRTKTPKAVDEYVKQVIHRGEQTLKNGFLGKPLTRDDIGVLRDYLIFTAMRLTGAHLLPFEVGASRGKRSPLTPNQVAPRFTLLSLEAVLQRSTFSDELQQDDTAFLKPVGVAKLLEVISHYEPTADGKVCKPKTVHIAVGSEDDYVRLSDFRSKRPVVLVLAYAPDVFMKCCLPPLEVVHRAYEDRTQFLFVNINYHDTYANGPVYFGPDANPKGARVTHPNSIEQRARMGKHIWLTGRIKSIGDATLIVTPELPDASAMKGYGFIRAAAERASLDDLAETNLKALKRWIDDAESGAVYKFAVDDDVELFINGQEAEPSDFKAGDFVGVWYDLTRNPAETTVEPVQIRASRAGELQPRSNINH
jgi:hypothetical protein